MRFSRTKLRIAHDEIEIPRKKLRFNSDLEDGIEILQDEIEISQDEIEIHFGPGGRN